MDIGYGLMMFSAKLVLHCSRKIPEDYELLPFAMVKLVPRDPQIPSIFYVMVVM